MLKITHLQKNYKGFSLDCSMEVQPGMITGLIGKNGSGKSTTFKAALGLIHVDGGEIELFGKKTAELTAEEKQKLGIVFADSGFSMYLTVTGVAKILESTYKDFEKKKFLQQCARFQLPVDKKIKELSTGMKAKLKVLVALSHKAELLILDEPTVGLDVVARDEVLTMLREYMEENEESALLMLAVFIPLGIHFGVEKGRYIGIVLWVIIIVTVYGLVKGMGISESMIDAWLDGLNWGLVVVTATLVTAVGYLGSYWFSVRLMEHKEF